MSRNAVTQTKLSSGLASFPVAHVSVLESLDGCNSGPVCLCKTGSNGLGGGGRKLGRSVPLPRGTSVPPLACVPMASVIGPGVIGAGGGEGGGGLETGLMGGDGGRGLPVASRSVALLVGSFEPTLAPSCLAPTRPFGLGIIIPGSKRPVTSGGASPAASTVVAPGMGRKTSGVPTVVVRF